MVLYFSCKGITFNKVKKSFIENKQKDSPKPRALLFAVNTNCVPDIKTMTMYKVATKTAEKARS